MSLDISFCENLIEVHKSAGDLHKLRDWNLESCRKLEILPSRLLLRSLNHLNLNHCERLEMKCLCHLELINSGIREWPSSLTHLTKELMYLALSDPKNLGNFLHSPNKLQLLEEEIDIPNANSFDGFSSLTELRLNSGDGDITELDFQYFPLLRYLRIYGCNIISIPQSISGLARLETIQISNCKQLREIPKRLKFNHQSFGNSVSFWVGEKFSKLAVCIAFRSVEAHTCQFCNVKISINGCKPYPNFYIDKGASEELWLFSVSRGQLNKQKLSEQNHIEVEVICIIGNPDKGSSDIIKWIGVNVECTCYPQNSDVTCLPLPCAMNGCGSSSIPNDTELRPFLPVCSTSSASDSDHRVLNNGRNYILAGTGFLKRRRICL